MSDTIECDKCHQTFVLDHRHWRCACGDVCVGPIHEGASHYVTYSKSITYYNSDGKLLWSEASIGGKPTVTHLPLEVPRAPRH